MVIDLHFHILPGIDDGPDDTAGSVALARAAVAGGITTVAATPHLREDHPAVRPEELGRRVRSLESRLGAERVPLEVVPAAEVDLRWAREAAPEALRLATYGQRGTDVLLETPYGPVPDTFEDAVFRLSIDGLRVLLAHPERNDTFQRNPERLFAMATRGVLLQISSGSLLSERRGSRSRALARALIERGLAHVLASDAHTTEPWRPPNLADGMAAAAEIAPARAEWMVTDAPAAILEGVPLPRPPAERSRPRRGLLARVRGPR